MATDKPIDWEARAEELGHALVAIRAIKADAWDEGCKAGENNGWTKATTFGHPKLLTNPYCTEKGD